MARISAILFTRHWHRVIFFLLSRHSVSPFLASASGAVALKIAQALSTRAYNLADEFINF